MAELDQARAFASLVRLSEDVPGSSLELGGFRGRERHKDAMLRNGLLISESVTPAIEQRLRIVCDRLRIPRSCVSAFVYNAPNIQADCLIDSPKTCVLRFSSGLVNLMDAKEFQFVAGHELGHFLLDHGACSQYIAEDSSEGYIVQRARELSADRIGYLAVDDLDESIQSIIKTVSGLGDEHLRFDVSAFLNQATLLANPRRGEARTSSHPSMLMRCRALMWFSMGIKSLSDLDNISSHELSIIDEKVSKDLEKYVDGEADVVDYEKIINEFALMRNKWLGLLKGLDQKQWQITNVVKLRVAGMEDASL